MPLEAAKTIGSGVNPVDSLFVSSQPKTLLTQPRDVALSPDGMYVCVTDVECHQVLVCVKVSPLCVLFHVDSISAVVAIVLAGVFWC